VDLGLSGIGSLLPPRAGDFRVPVHMKSELTEGLDPEMGGQCKMDNLVFLQADTFFVYLFNNSFVQVRDVDFFLLVKAVYLLTNAQN
jgi:hypothetical protein